MRWSFVFEFPKILVYERRYKEWMRFVDKMVEEKLNSLVLMVDHGFLEANEQGI
jgi:hypothetical protein